MGPRKRLAYRAKRPIPSFPTDRRSKARHDRPPPGETSSPAPNPPSSPISSAFAGRAVTTGRFVDFSFLEREGFSFGRKIKDLGWDIICSLELPTYPGLVREFYSSLRRSHESLIGVVRGKEVRVSETILAQLLRLPTQGPAPAAHENRAEALKVILGGADVNPLEVVYASRLSAEMRLLLSIVQNVFFHKIGRFDFISERDLVVMYCIIEGYALNLPKMMMTFMGEAAFRARPSLPYGMVLTRLFREFGVQIDVGEPSRLLRHTDFYNEKSLLRMRFAKVDGQWVHVGDAPRRPGRQRRAPSVDSSESPGSPEDHAAPPSPTTPAPPPAHTESHSAHAAPSAPQLDDDQLRRMASMIVDEMAQRGQSPWVSQSEFRELRASVSSISDRLSSIDQRISQQQSDSSEWKTFMSSMTASMSRVVGILEGRTAGPSGMIGRTSPAASSSPSQSFPAQPPQPSKPPFRTYTRANVGFRGPSSRTRTKVHRSSPRASSPIHLPSDQD